MPSENPINSAASAARNVAANNAAANNAAAKELTTPQLAALDAVLNGSSVTDAAAAAGVARSTVHDWLRDNLPFQAALNRGRRDLRQAIVHRLERLANDATECVGKAVRDGDVKAALEIVKRLDVFAARYLGSDNLAELQMEKEENRQKLEIREQRLSDNRTLFRLGDR